MDVREKLVGLLFKCTPKNIKLEWHGEKIEVAISQGNIADYLIDNGVTVQGVGGCCRCKDTSEMMVAISNKLVAGVRTGWLGGNLPARYCPFCGRKLPQPPKGE